MQFPRFYTLSETTSAYSLKFFFVSHGKKEVVKAIEYTFYRLFEGKEVYNLGFGDYDFSTETFSDDTLSNNGDTYKVLNTVLRSIALFFQYYPQALLTVQGSDSSPEFEKMCRLHCSRKCSQECKKLNRRITIYRNYLDKHYPALSQDYIFYGGKRRTSDQKIVLEKYRRYEPYDVVMIERKIVYSGIFEEPTELFTMKKKTPKTMRSDTELLAPIMGKFKDQVLFPRLVENAKNLLQNAEFASK